jgi:hypothetical protein
MKMRTRHDTCAAIAAAVIWMVAPDASAAGACSFKWDVTHEMALYATPPQRLAAGSNTADAPAIDAGRLYALELWPQEAVRYSVAPSKKMLADGAFGGVLRLKVNATGQYRVAIDAGFWLDLLADGKALATVDFNGTNDCSDGPRKIVVFDIPADAELLLQISAATAAAAKLTVTAIAKAR